MEKLRAIDFGRVVDGMMHLKAYGRIVAEEWHRTAVVHPNVVLDAFGTAIPGSVSTIMRQFKSIVTKRMYRRRGTPGASVGQRNYYEHIIRNERGLHRIRRHIADNPQRWNADRYPSD